MRPTLRIYWGGGGGRGGGQDNIVGFNVEEMQSQSKQDYFKKLKELEHIQTIVQEMGQLCNFSSFDQKSNLISSYPPPPHHHSWT